MNTQHIAATAMLLLGLLALVAPLAARERNARMFSVSRVASQPRPPLDRNTPQHVETATFCLG